MDALQQPEQNISQMADPKHPPRRRLPKKLAVIDAGRCTACAACIEICPTDCIVRVAPNPQAPGLQAWCEIDWDRCIGCGLCIRLPRKGSDSYTMLICPWEAIEMVPVAELPAWVELAAGPRPASDRSRPRLAAMADRQVQAAGR